MNRLIIFLVAALCTSCGAEEAKVSATQVIPCEESQGSHCVVSIYALIASPSSYDKVRVSVKGFVADGQYVVLFANRESAEHSILENGIRLQSDQGYLPRLAKAAQNGQYIRVIGEFSRRVQDSHLLDKGSIYGTVGSIRVTSVSSEGEDAWACFKLEGQTEGHFDRPDACPNLEVRRELEKERGR